METLTLQEKKIIFQIIANVSENNTLGFLMTIIASKLQEEIKRDSQPPKEPTE